MDEWNIHAWMDDPNPRGSNNIRILVEDDGIKSAYTPHEAMRLDIYRRDGHIWQGHADAHIDERQFDDQRFREPENPQGDEHDDSQPASAAPHGDGGRAAIQGDGGQAALDSAPASPAQIEETLEEREGPDEAKEEVDDDVDGEADEEAEEEEEEDAQEDEE